MAQAIGFIGLGIMGRRMARNLLKAGHSPVVHSRSQSDVLITMLPNSPDVELVALGKDGIIEGARPGLREDLAGVSA